MTIYTVFTPAGEFTAEWSDDPDELVLYRGEPAAVEYVAKFLAASMITGRDGHRLNMDGMEPRDLYGFCQSEEYAITVIPDDAAVRADVEDIAQEEQAHESV